MKPLSISFRQDVKHGSAGVRIFQCSFKESAWMQYTGNNRFISVTEADLMNPKIIPAIFCPVKIMFTPEFSKSSNDINFGYMEEGESGQYYTLYYRGHLFVIDPVLQVACVADDEKTMKKIVNAASYGRIMHKQSFEIVVRAISIDSPSYFDAV